MKNIMMAISVFLPVSVMAQVRTMHKLPETNNIQQTIQPTVQTAANLVKVVLVCNENNLAGKYQPLINLFPTNSYYTEAIIDNPISNQNPNAFIMVTSVRWDPMPLSVLFDKDIQKWKIRIDPNGQNNKSYGNVIPNEKGQNMLSVLPYEPRSLNIGDKFNILINQ